MDLMFVKWIAAVVLLSVTLFFATLPLILFRRIHHIAVDSRHTKYSRFISLLSCAGGGVFLGTCLLHLFPEVQEQMSKVFQLLQIKQTFPVAEFLLAFGFLVMLVIEQMVLAFQHTSDEQLPLLSHSHNHPHDIPGDVTVRHIQPNYGSRPPGTSDLEPSHSVHEDRSSHSPLRSAVLVLALSLHSLFEGLAIGLQGSAENVVRILVAVFIHKSVIAFTLGLNLTNSKLKKNVIAFSVGIFSSMSPIGIMIGSIVIDLTQGLGLTLSSGILQGISAGTFVYVTFFEILPHEMNSMEDKLWKVLFLILGFSAISLLVLYVPN